ncbi:MAG: tetratricopeptide repeat protein [Myxococcota bacterium]
MTAPNNLPSTPAAGVPDLTPKSHTVYQPALSGSDRFVELGNKLVDKVVEFRVPLLVGVIGIFTVAAGIGGYNSYQASQNASASEETYRLTSKLPGAENELARFGLDEGDEKVETDATNLEKLKVAGEALGKVASKYSGLTGGAQARLEQARVLVRSGDLAGAEAAYGALVKENQEPVWKLRGYMGVASVLQKQDKAADAVSQLEKAKEELKSGVYAELVALELAQAHEVAGDSAKATAGYEAFLKDFPSSSLKKVAEGHLLSLKAMAAAPAMSAPVEVPAAPVEAAPAPAPAAPAPAEAAPAGGAAQ